VFGVGGEAVPFFFSAGPYLDRWTGFATDDLNPSPQLALSALNPSSISENDVVESNRRNQEISTGQGNDTVMPGRGSDRCTLGAGDDICVAGNGQDFVFGGRGDDIINGGNGRDIIRGGAGNDTLTGGAGRDKIWGGDGADEFWIGPGSGTTRIMDYDTSVDTLHFASGVFAPELTLEQMKDQVISETSVSADNELYININGQTAIIRNVQEGHDWEQFTAFFTGLFVQDESQVSSYFDF
jgi:Ca2+-binding RTX toxin-like protein